MARSTRIEQRLEGLLVVLNLTWLLTTISSKIPTIVAYKNGKALAFGVEAKEYMDDDEYEVASWFKVSASFFRQLLMDGH
jgi:hypothetical protein